MEQRSIKDIEYIKKLVRNNWIFILIYIFFLYVAIRTPVGGDDWEISTWYRNGFFSDFFGFVRSWSSFNGRVFNNLMDAMFTHYRIIWILLSPLAHVGIIYYLSKLFSFSHKKLALLVMVAMLLSVSVEMRAQIQFHAVGSISYVFSICLIFIYTFLTYKEISGSGMKYFSNRFLNGLLYLGLAFVISLWIENLTIGYIAFLIITLIQQLKQKRKIPFSISYGLIGGMLGALFMFTSVGIHNRINTNLTLLQTIKTNLPICLNHLVNSAPGIYVIYFIVSLLLVKSIHYINNKAIKYIYCIYSFTISAIILIRIMLQQFLENYYPVGSISTFIDNHFLNLSGDSKLPLFIACLTILSMLVPILYLKERKKLLTLYIVAFMSAAPMVLSPGARNMMLAQYIIIGLTGYMASLLVLNKKDYLKLAYIAISAVCLIRIDIYANILEGAAKVSALRNSIITNYTVNSIKAENRFDKTIILPNYDEKAFIGNFESDYYSESVKNYYDLPRDTIILFDDGFLAYGLKFTDGNEGKYKLSLNQYLRYSAEYSYTFYIYKDNVLCFSQESKGTTIAVDLNENGNYTAECVITNATNSQKTIETAQPLVIN